jgi:phosphoglycerate dehydrogenase-like enzyme
VSHDEIINYLLNLWTDQWLRKSRISNGEAAFVELDANGHATAGPRIVFPKRLVCCIEAPSFSNSETAKTILTEHDLTLITAESNFDCSGVLAVVLGDTSFSGNNAATYPRLRTVARFGSGTDGIATQELEALGVEISRLPTSGVQAVAEYVLGVAILLLRDYPSQAQGLQVEPHRWRATGRPGLQLSECTIGLLGLGSIGLQVAKLFRELGARVVAHNRSWPTSLKRITTILGIDRARSIEELCAASDIISIHVGLAKETSASIDSTMLEVIHRSGKKPGIINTARGEVIDEAALLDALERGWLRGAALDVWSAERAATSPMVARLRKHPLVLPTPHIAGYTNVAIESAIVRCAMNVVALVEGRRSEVDELLP